MTFSELITLYNQKRVIKAVTLRGIRNSCRSLTDFLGHDAELDSITLDSVVAWRHHMGSTVSAMSYNSYLTQIQAVMRYAATHSLCNPSHPLLGLGKARVERRSPPTVNEEFFEAAEYFLSHPSIQSENGLMEPRWFWWSVIVTLAHTGMRRRQLVELRWEDVRLDEGILIMRRESSKSGKPWVLPIPAVVMPVLQDLHQRTLQVAGTFNEHAKVFNLPLFSLTGTCKALTDNYLTARFNKLSQVIGVHASAHRLRHTATTRWLNSTGQLKTVKTILGHSNTQATLDYNHPDMSDMRDALNSLE